MCWIQRLFLPLGRGQPPLLSVSKSCHGVGLVCVCVSVWHSTDARKKCPTSLIQSNLIDLQSRVPHSCAEKEETLEKQRNSKSSLPPTHSHIATHAHKRGLALTCNFMITLLVYFKAAGATLAWVSDWLAACPFIPRTAVKGGSWCPLIGRWSLTVLMWTAWEAGKGAGRRSSAVSE